MSLTHFRRKTALKFAYVQFLSYICARNWNTMSEKELEAKLSVGLKQSYRRVVEEHRRNNQPLIFCENGQVKYVDPFTVEI